MTIAGADHEPLITGDPDVITISPVGSGVEYGDVVVAALRAACVVAAASLPLPAVTTVAPLRVVEANDVVTADVAESSADATSVLPSTVLVADA